MWIRRRHRLYVQRGAGSVLADAIRGDLWTGCEDRSDDRRGARRLGGGRSRERVGHAVLLRQGAAKAKANGGKDLDEILAKGGSVGMYHTAGKGTRLALPGSENNNKPGVKLPSLVQVNGRWKNLTILEAVIRQTGRYAAERAGRCSVFWGDQIFGAGRWTFIER